MPKNALSPIVLSDAQKALLEKNWQMDVLGLTQLVFDNSVLDRRSLEFRTIKAHLAGMGKIEITETTGAAKKIESIQLSENDRTYIATNYRSATGPVEMARVLFSHPGLTLASPQVRAVAAYCRHLDPTYQKDQQLVEDPDYTPPASIKQLIERMESYSMNRGENGKPLFDSDKMTTNDTKQISTLLGYMKLPLFKIEASKYLRKMDRVLFESTFIWVCWNKPDLLAEEVHQYISFAGETVKKNQVERTVQLLDERLALILNGDGKLNMAEIELLNSVREKANASMKQQNALLKTLVGDRAKRLGDKIAGVASLHPLVQAWKNKVDRDKIIMMNERKQKAALKGEVERLSSMDALKAEIFGLNKDDIIR